MRSRFIALILVGVLATGLMRPATAGATSGTLQLLGQLALPNPAVRNSDIWGWVDPGSNKEYAVVGKWPSTVGSAGAQVFIIDVDDPTNPTLVTTLSSVPSFDLKMFGTYLYLCDGDASGGNDSKIYDLANPASPQLGGSFPSCHNITIDDRGYMYLSYSTLRIYDLNPDPKAPAFLWSDGISGGHDATVIGEMLYDFHGTSGTFIYDVANPANPILLGTITDPAIAYHHSGWPTADGKYLYINDELGSAATADITCWNIANPVYPVKVGSYTDPNATVHNTYRIGNYLMSSFYVAGFRVFDIGGPPAFYLANEYDTSPAYTGNGLYEGCWGVYPFAPSGVIYASDMQGGIFLFKYSPPTVSGIPDQAPLPSALVLNQNYPNPFNPTTTITYELPHSSHVTLAIYNTTGQRVRTLVDDTQGEGPQSAAWNGRDNSGRVVASGVYFYRLDAGGSTETRRMILLK